MEKYQFYYEVKPLYEKQIPRCFRLLAASLLPAGSVFAASIDTVSTVPVVPAQHILDTKTSTSKDVKTVPPIVQATLNKLLKIEPAIKQLTIASVHTDDSQTEQVNFLC